MKKHIGIDYGYQNDFADAFAYSLLARKWREEFDKKPFWYRWFYWFKMRIIRAGKRIKRYFN